MKTVGLLTAWSLATSFTIAPLLGYQESTPTSDSSVAAATLKQQSPDEPDENSSSQFASQKLRAVVRSAFVAVHDGWSSDEVILNSELNQKFIEQCQSRLPEIEEKAFNWTLMNLRKAGQLNIAATKRNSQSVSHLTPLAEIAARHIYDKYKLSTDQMMCDPQLRTEFDAVVKSIDHKADAYLVRKAAFHLRKQRRLKPELLVRIADWEREIQVFPLADVRANVDLIPKLPGVYIFRDQTGFLYIGQADNLNNRLKTHFEDSHNFSLASYLKDQSNDNITLEIHSFPADSRAKETMIRRAYESELIASRKPRFNIQP